MEGDNDQSLKDIYEQPAKQILFLYAIPEKKHFIKNLPSWQGINGKRSQ